MAKKWKIGVVYDTSRKSKGHHGTHFAFTGLPGMQQVLVDSNTDDLDLRIKVMGASEHYTDFRVMIEKEKPDIVSVCSRLAEDHFEVIEAAAKAGCHILCEKPMSASLQEAKTVVELACKYGVKIAVAHLARHALMFRTARQMIQAGEIGRPLTFYGRGKEDERGGGEDMMVLGTHILDLAVYFFGAPEYVFADVRQAGQPITPQSRIDATEPVGLCAGDNIWASFRLPGEVNGVFESRKGLCRDQVRMGITVVGTEGTISVRYDNERKLRISKSQMPPEDEAHYKVVPLNEDREIPESSTELDLSCYGSPAWYFANANRFAALDLIDAIENDREPACTAKDAVISLEMIYAIYRSSLEHRAIELPLTDLSHPLA